KHCVGAKSYYRSNILNSISRKRSKIAIESSFKTIDLCSTNLLAVENSLRTRYACASRFQDFIFSIYPDFIYLVKKAEIKVKFLGGTDLKPEGGIKFRILTYVLGWKLARRLQRT